MSRISDQYVWPVKDIVLKGVKTDTIYVAANIFDF